jgi:hypothetical protein
MAGGKTDELKGRVKEAAGALTGDAKLKREGQPSRASLRSPACGRTSASTFPAWP